MSRIIQPAGKVVWPRRLPIGNISIDRTNPLTNGLVAAYVPGVMRGVDVSGNGLHLTPGANTTTSPLVSSGPEGPGFLGNSAAGGGYVRVLPSTLKGLSQMSAYVRGFVIGTLTAATTTVAGIQDTSSGDSVVGWYGLTGNVIGAETEVGNATTTVDTTTITLTVNTAFSLGHTFLVGGNSISYKDGAQQATAALSGAASSTNGYSMVIGSSSGASGNNSSWRNGVIYVLYVWTRALTAFEMRLLDLDPYCFLVAEEREMPSLFLASVAARRRMFVCS